MERVLAGCEGVVIYLDDLLIVGATQQEHDKRLEAVREALQRHHVTINDRKSAYSVTSVPFLGHVISAAGVSPGPDKIVALQNMPNPTNVSELRSFLGLVTYLGKFVPKLAQTTQPLTNLLRGPWQWTPAYTQAADGIREHFSRAPLLRLFAPDLPTRIEVDASGAGIGSVLAHQHPDGEWYTAMFRRCRQCQGHKEHF